MGIDDILDKARTLEGRISRALSRAAEDASGRQVREPLEIVHGILDAVERQVQPGSRGARLFPFNQVTVSVAAPSRDARARLEAVFAAAPSLHDRIVDRLRSARCDVADLQIEVAFPGRAARHWDHPQFHVAFDRVAPVVAATPAVDATRARIEITVLRGAAERRSYAFTLSRIDFGRGIEVRDDRQRLLRTNHVAFVEGAAGVNQTISRRHAHITVDPSSGEHRLHDDRSAQGTGILRGGRTVPVPPGTRGVRLSSGDEIVLGEARVRVRIDVAR
jgi:FHA domain-containing protein